jgi:hypothetical protein
MASAVGDVFCMFLTFTWRLFHSNNIRSPWMREMFLHLRFIHLKYGRLNVQHICIHSDSLFLYQYFRLKDFLIPTWNENKEYGLQVTLQYYSQLYLELQSTERINRPRSWREYVLYTNKHRIICVFSNMNLGILTDSLFAQLKNFSPRWHTAHISVAFWDSHKSVT